MRALTLSILVLLSSATMVHANALDDGNDGLKALQGGDNDTAITLFTRAIKSRQLKGDDLEFAFANRGQAYLNKLDYSDAISDLDRARMMKPDDADAQKALVKAVSLTLPAVALPGESGGNLAKQAGVGFLNMLAKSVADSVARNGQSN